MSKKKQWLKDLIDARMAFTNGDSQYDAMMGAIEGAEYSWEFRKAMLEAFDNHVKFDKDFSVDKVLADIRETWEARFNRSMGKVS